MLSDRCLSVCPVLSVCLSVTFVHCGQTVRRMKMKLGVQVGLGHGHIVLGGDPAPLPIKEVESTPQFSAHFYCCQTAGCIKMPLGMEVGLSPRDFLLDGTQLPSLERETPTPTFRPTFVVAKRSPISATTAELLSTWPMHRSLDAYSYEALHMCKNSGLSLSFAVCSLLVTGNAMVLDKTHLYAVMDSVICICSNSSFRE